MPEPPSTKPLGSPFLELQSVESTNNYAREQIKAVSLPENAGGYQQALHGTAIFAHEQLTGKGQRNKTWNSEKGSNIILSLVIKPQPLQLAAQFQLNACVAVAVHEFFMKYAGDDTKIKWPNDLYWQDRKAGGVLIESLVRSRESGKGSSASGPDSYREEKRAAQWEWAIIGMGININQTVFPAELPNPVSLKQITGKNFNAVDFAKELCTVLDERFNELINHGFDRIYSTYLLHLYKKNEKVRLKKDNRVFEAIIKTITPAGRLVVQHAIEEEFGFGEVEWLI
ncbi:MAG: biotin--[acetyl-CoA-carboxylase] ligase [Chitinophagaceae bacterium]